MKEFAKIFKMPDGGMVLVTQSYEDLDDCTYKVNLITRNEHGIEFSQILSYEMESHRDKGFDLVSQQVAENFYKDMNSLC